MKLLILGGTVFLGRHFVEAALDRHYDVTLFNRGKSGNDLYPDVEKLVGDRDGGLDVLRGRTWDAVIDTSGYVPRLVGDSARLLADATEHYTFISSISVYSDFSAETITEDAPTQQLEDERVEEVSGATYGGLKVLCERAAEAAMPGRVLNARAGLIVGMYDSVNRFPYWVNRIAKGGEVLVPDSPDCPVQLINARDIAEWSLDMAASKSAGTFNVTGPNYRLTLGELFETIKDVTASDATFVWVSEEFLLENEVSPFEEIPLWLPKANQGVMNTDVRKAIDAGLTFRSLADTTRATYEWLQASGAHRDNQPRKVGDLEIRSGLTPDREADLLAKWRAQSAN
ncbi:MAG: epimerase [Chloroflexi bacterium]|nr:MAG: epimerase [Chloroflexota bacterium]